MSLYANSLRAQHHISGKTTFSILCAAAHKVRESRPPGSVRGVFSNGHPYRDRDRAANLADNRNQHVARPDALFDCLNKVDPRIQVIDVDENLIFGKMSCKPVIQATREVRGVIATVIDQDFAAHLLFQTVT